MLTFISYVYLDGNVIVRKKKLRAFGNYGNKDVSKKYELLFLEEIGYFP